MTVTVIVETVILFKIEYKMRQSLTQDTQNEWKSSKSMKNLRQRCVKVKLDTLQVYGSKGFRNCKYCVEVINA